MRNASRKTFPSLIVLFATFSLASWLGAQTTPPPPAKSKHPAATTGKTAPPPAIAPTPRGVFTETDKESFEKETRIAVIVAPSYRDSGLATLRYTYADAVEMKAELERQGYTVRVVPTTEATADGIRQTLSNQKTYLEGTTQATLLFAFMGHGFQDSHGRNYLMTYGANLANMDTEALAVAEVESLMNASGARRRLIFVDACRSTAGTRDTEKARTMSEFKAAEGLAILLATRPGAYSYEDPELSHGVFTYFVLEGMRGKAAGKDGFVSFHDLSDYVQRSVTTYAMKRDMSQKPLATMKDVGGDFLLGVAAQPKPEEIQPIPGAAAITTDAIVMRAVDSAGLYLKSFFVMLNDDSMTLVDARSGQPYALLKEHPEQLKDQKAMQNATYRWFAGDAADNQAIHMVAETKGSEMLQVWGRIGKPCPFDRACSPVDYPLLPGEIRDQKSSAVKLAGKLAVLGGLSKKTEKAGKALEAKKEIIDKSGLTTDSRDKFVWTKFDLANTSKLSRASTAPAAPDKK